MSFLLFLIGLVIPILFLNDFKVNFLFLDRFLRYLIRVTSSDNWGCQLLSILVNTCGCCYTWTVYHTVSQFAIFIVATLNVNSRRDVRQIISYMLNGHNFVGGSLQGTTDPGGNRLGWLFVWARRVLLVVVRSRGSRCILRRINKFICWNWVRSVVLQWCWCTNNYLIILYRLHLRGLPWILHPKLIIKKIPCMRPNLLIHLSFFNKLLSLTLLNFFRNFNRKQFLIIAQIFHLELLILFLLFRCLLALFLLTGYQLFLSHTLHFISLYYAFILTLFIYLPFLILFNI